ncbi:hypothetical protein D3C87_1994960 [compost metagenome]
MKSGVECRPIVAGNFAKNPVVQWFDHEIHAELKNAEWIDKQGFFIGNHQVPMHDQIKKLKSVFSQFESSL